ncbi:Hypothetical predicted protein [Cloeon dipterum]|uniref:Chitin-binding type-2 domain-containing protein n=1 Tax=Cloeon dipterum TaxID=197152 RepID=A0A8S1CKH8_9INSE|nr:Hypothetical predicted protein [Cloeon dipterum]
MPTTKHKENRKRWDFNSVPGLSARLYGANTVHPNVTAFVTTRKLNAEMLETKKPLLVLCIKIAVIVQCLVFTMGNLDMEYIDIYDIKSYQCPDGGLQLHPKNCHAVILCVESLETAEFVPTAAVQCPRGYSIDKSTLLCEPEADITPMCETARGNSSVTSLELQMEDEGVIMPRFDACLARGAVCIDCYRIGYCFWQGLQPTLIKFCKDLNANKPACQLSNNDIYFNFYFHVKFNQYFNFYFHVKFNKYFNFHFNVKFYQYFNFYFHVKLNKYFNFHFNVKFYQYFNFYFHVKFNQYFNFYFHVKFNQYFNFYFHVKFNQYFNFYFHVKFNQYFNFYFYVKLNKYFNFYFHIKFNQYFNFYFHVKLDKYFNFHFNVKLDKYFNFHDDFATPVSKTWCGLHWLRHDCSLFLALHSTSDAQKLLLLLPWPALLFR